MNKFAALVAAALVVTPFALATVAQAAQIFG